MTSKKQAPVKKSNITNATLIVIDLITIIFSLLPNIFAFSVTGLFVYSFYSSSVFILLVAPLILLFSFVCFIYILRLCLPTLKPGRYKRELNKPIVTWFCHFALARAAKLSGLVRFLQAINITKFLYWRALGAQVSFNIVCSYDIDLVDVPLIKIGKGVTIGSETSISCHSDIGNYLLLGSVNIEDNVFLAMANTIGPNTIIKQGAWIGFGNGLVNQTIEENQKIKNIKPGE